MWISTRGRYALRVIIDLAELDNIDYIPLKDIAARQNISEKYLESIISIMSRNEIVRGVRGKGGGYKLAMEPSDITVGRILKLTEGSLALVACLEKEPNRCEKITQCKTLKIWQDLDKLVDEYVENVTIEDLINDDSDCGDYII